MALMKMPTNAVGGGDYTGYTWSDIQAFYSGTVNLTLQANKKYLFFFYGINSAPLSPTYYDSITGASNITLTKIGNITSTSSTMAGTFFLGETSGENVSLSLPMSAYTIYFIAE